MAHHQNKSSKDARLVLSSDAKPRLKWTPELHQRFLDAIVQLGGPDKATPKSLMRTMNIHGLTLYHLKSHLQKFRLGKNQQLQSHRDINKQEDYSEESQRMSHLPAESCDEAQTQMNESIQIARALQMQMEVQRKLHEQIEVQKHLQRRIEAQGKYLQAVMRKAHETLAGYGSSSAGAELARAELSRLVSMVDMGNSLESSLTSSDSSAKREEEETVELSLMDMRSSHGNGANNDRASGRKRFKGSTAHDERFKRFDGFLEKLDLNAKVIDLNS